MSIVDSRKSDIVKIEENSLFEHLFWENFDHCLLFFLVLVFNFYLSEFWSCWIEDTSSLNTALLIASTAFSLTVLGQMVRHSGEGSGSRRWVSIYNAKFDAV